MSCTQFQKPGSFFFFFKVSNQGPCFTATEEDGGDKRLVELELMKQMVLHHQILFSLAVSSYCEVRKVGVEGVRMYVCLCLCLCL